MSLMSSEPVWPRAPTRPTLVTGAAEEKRRRAGAVMPARRPERAEAASGEANQAPAAGRDARDARPRPPTDVEKARVPAGPGE